MEGRRWELQRSQWLGWLELLLRETTKEVNEVTQGSLDYFELRGCVHSVISRTWTSNEHKNGTWDQKPRGKTRRAKAPMSWNVWNMLRKTKPFQATTRKKPGRKAIASRTWYTLFFKQNDFQAASVGGRNKVREALNLKIDIFKKSRHFNKYKSSVLSKLGILD